MSTHHQRQTRTNYFIEKGFQFRFVLKFCIILLLGVIISTGLLFLFSQDTLTSSFEHSRLQITNTGLAILPSVIFTNLITLALITLATIFLTLIVSHKIAGPLFRFEKELKEIGQGDLTKKVVLRSQDQISAMADAMNQMVEELHEKMAAIQRDVENIRKSAVEQKTAEELIPALEHLQEKIETSFKM